MFWDRIFWVWFIFSVAVVLYIFLLGTSYFSLMFGLLIAGLGMVKLAEEAGKNKLEKKKPKEILMSRALLRRLEKSHHSK